MCVCVCVCVCVFVCVQPIFTKMFKMSSKTLNKQGNWTEEQM